MDGSQVDMPLNVWDYGIAVGVIVGFFIAFKYGVSAFLTAYKEQGESDKIATREQNEAFRQSLKDITADHRAERDEWKENSNKREERIVSVCDELIKTIHEQKSHQS